MATSTPAICLEWDCCCRWSAFKGGERRPSHLTCERRHPCLLRSRRDAMRGLLAKLVNGEITRRQFAERILGAGFGVVTAESILDTVAVAQDRRKAPPVHRRETFHVEPFSEKTPYEQWMEHEGVPIHTGYHVADVRALEVGPWKRLGAGGALINLEGAEATDGAYICEIAPRASTKPQKYMFEESIYALDGEGETTVWNERGAKQAFKWKKGALFSPPLNTWRQHVNRGDLPARFISVTDAPLAFDLFHSAEFIFNNDFVFGDRYRGGPDYFTANGSKLRAAGSAATFGEGEKGAVGVLETGLIPDLDNLRLYDAKSRGVSNKSAEVILSDNAMQSHAPSRPRLARIGDERRRLHVDVDAGAALFQGAEAGAH